LMDRHGIPRRKQAGVVTFVLGLSRSHGNRKLRGLVPMTLDEIGRIAEHFEETLLHALEPCLAHGMEPAVLMLGDLKVPCEAMLEETLRPPFEDDGVCRHRRTGKLSCRPGQRLDLARTAG
ncbi:helix-turn-helix domain-containing protein, partial [Azohydromonas lata]|uniref:helix-turn-helix domain-containing protein n=1 Tax=Azohydromonas lata TaxID=45677 RepID=UPI0021756B9B